VSVSPSQISEGSAATFTITANQAVAQNTVVAYAMGGKAGLGRDYALNGNVGQITLLAGQTSAAITLNAIADGVKEKKETAVMTLQPGSGYQFPNVGKKKKKSKAPSATVMIVD